MNNDTYRDRLNGLQLENEALRAKLAAYQSTIGQLSDAAQSTKTDTISRQAAIDAVEEVDWYHIGKTGELIHGANSQEHEPLYKAKDIYAVLEKLPSAQPELTVCADCKHWICHDRRCGIWNHGVKPLDYCSRAERRSDE